MTRASAAELPSRRALAHTIRASIAALLFAKRACCARSLYGKYTPFGAYGAIMAKPAKPRPSVFDETCSARDALELIAGKWPMLILTALADGPMRNGALLRRVGGVSQKMLTQTLRELERNGLIIREDHTTVPPHVEYRLS